MGRAGLLAGVKVIELGGIGPGLADLGADVVRVRRPGGLTMPAEDRDLLYRGKRIVDVDIKTRPQALLELAVKADVLLDCFRPDINYLSQTGALSALAYRDRPPMPPLNLLADFGGGSISGHLRRCATYSPYGSPAGPRRVGRACAAVLAHACRIGRPAAGRYTSLDELGW